MPAPLLVRPPAASGTDPRWDAQARRVLAGPGAAAGRGGDAGRMVRVLGGPGTGKTTLVAEVAVRRIVHGADPDSVLVLTHSRRAAVQLREAITERLAAYGAGRAAGSPMLGGPVVPGRLPSTVREPVVRTVHSYAFALLRLVAVRDGSPPPRLLAGPEQDAVVRELLGGELIDDGGARWPERLRPALGLAAFAAELRDLLLRAAERGLGPEDLIRIGRDHARPEWVAAGRFFARYEQVTLLRAAAGAAGQQAGTALDAAELVSAALLVLDTDERALAGERARVRHLLVDDAQHLDPQQIALARRVSASASEFVLAGDPDQAVFSFRGADPDLLRGADPGGSHTVVLRTDHRGAPAVREAVARLAARLPGARTPPPIGPDEDPGVEDPAELAEPAGRVTTALFRSPAQEAAWVADQLRRAHLLDGVPWSRMAVLVRSSTRAAPVLRRALLGAGVPLALLRDALPLARQPAVWPLLALLRGAVEKSTMDENAVVALLGSPLVGADPLALRRLRRGLRRLDQAAGGDTPSGELLVDAVLGNDPLVGLEPVVSRPVRWLGGLLAVARDALAGGDSAEQVLWRVWQASGLQAGWVAAAGRSGGGRSDLAAAQADRDLDAVVALFDEAARFVDRFPGSGVRAFADHLAAQEFGSDSLAPRAPAGEAVQLLTAHAATGREWTVVAVPGVQEGTWPDLRLRGSLLGVESLVDVLGGIDPDRDVVSRTAPLLAEERRLLLVAASRARRVLLVSAVEGEDEQPSRFLDELDGLAAESDQDGPEQRRQPIRPPRALVLAELVGELRRAVCDPDADPGRRERAATQLARLAAAGVAGADPGAWSGLSQISTPAPLRMPGQRVMLSPSTMDTIGACPLRWLLERHGGQDLAELPSVTGMLVHALVQAAAGGATDEQLAGELSAAWAGVDAGAPWFSRKEERRIARMLVAFQNWVAATRGELDVAGIELDMAVEVPGTDVTLRGRVDRLERDRDGAPVIVDVKTARQPISKDKATEHPQLGTYQLAAALGAFAGDDPGPKADRDAPGGAAALPTGGARLLYVSKADRSGSATERVQPPLDADAVARWGDQVRAAAQAVIGPEFTAKENPDCPRCPARTSCPLSSSGRQTPTG